MKIINVALTCLVTNLVFNPAQAMNEQPLNEKKPEQVQLLPDEMVAIVISKLSLKDLSKNLFVSKWWLKTIETNFQDLALIRADDLTEDLSFNKLNFLVLNIKNWSQERLTIELEETNFMWLENMLIKSLEQQIRIKIPKLNINTYSDLASFLCAYCFVNLEDASGAAWLGARRITSEIGKDAEKFFDVAATSSSYMAVGEAALNTILNVFGPENLNPAPQAIKEARLVYDESSKHVIMEALAKLSYQSPNDIGMAAWKIINLYTLAHIAQDIFIQSCLINAYAVRQKSNSHKKPFRSADEVLKFYAKNIWKQKRFLSNPYVLSLKRIAEFLAAQVKNIEQTNVVVKALKDKNLTTFEWISN